MDRLGNVPCRTGNTEGSVGAKSRSYPMGDIQESLSWTPLERSAGDLWSTTDSITIWSDTSSSHYRRSTVCGRLANTQGTRGSMSFFPLKFQTEDGYTFFILYSGRIVDSLDPERVNMSWPDVESFLQSQGDRATVFNPPASK